MLFAKEEDIVRCMKIVQHEFDKINLCVSQQTLREVTINIMNISYSKGGDYSDTVIKSFTEVYMEEGLYKKFRVYN